jgi:large subunit ribosomal protein L21
MKYAIIEANGRQYKAEEGKTIIINARLGKKDESVMFDKVLLLVDGENTQVGTPYVNGLFIKGKILESGRGKKLVIQKFKSPLPPKDGI